MRRMKETRRRFRMRMTKERWMQSMQEGDEEGVQAQSIDTYHYTPALKAFINTDYSQGCSTADHNNTHNSSSRSRRKRQDQYNSNCLSDPLIFCSYSL